MTPPEETPTPSAGHRRATLFVKGHVQGVGFRWWTRSRALELGLVGHARNMSDGRVEVVAQGRGADIAAAKFETFLQAIQGHPMTRAAAQPYMSDAAPHAPLAIEPQSEELIRHIWWGSGSRATAERTRSAARNRAEQTAADRIAEHRATDAARDETGRSARIPAAALAATIAAVLVRLATIFTRLGLVGRRDDRSRRDREPGCRQSKQELTHGTILPG